MSVATMIATWGQSATLKRQGVTKDASGGMLQSFAAVSANTTAVPCAVQPMSSSTRQQYLGRNLVRLHQVFFERPVEARETDLLEVKTRGRPGVRTFLVLGDLDPGAGLGEVYRVDVEEQP